MLQRYEDEVHLGDLHSSKHQQTVVVVWRRDLVAARAGYREALVALGGLPAMVALLDAPEKPVTMFVSEALGYIASTPSCREAIRCRISHATDCCVGKNAISRCGHMHAQ